MGGGWNGIGHGEFRQTNKEDRARVAAAVAARKAKGGMFGTTAAGAPGPPLAPPGAAPLLAGWAWAL